MVETPLDVDARADDRPCGVVDGTLIISDDGWWIKSQIFVKARIKDSFQKVLIDTLICSRKESLYCRYTPTCTRITNNWENWNGYVECVLSINHVSAFDSLSSPISLENTRTLFELDSIFLWWCCSVLLWQRVRNYLHWIRVFGNIPFVWSSSILFELGSFNLKMIKYSLMRSWRNARKRLIYQLVL